LQVREDVLIYAIFALLTFPSTDFALESLVTRAAPALNDGKRRVRQARRPNG
jgi:hypothetical protein